MIDTDPSSPKAGKTVAAMPISGDVDDIGIDVCVQPLTSRVTPRSCLYVHHTDAEREWAYDRRSHVGRLGKGLDEAKARGWTVVSMKDDWARIYPD